MSEKRKFSQIYIRDGDGGSPKLGFLHQNLHMLMHLPNLSNYIMRMMFLFFVLLLLN